MHKSDVRAPSVPLAPAHQHTIQSAGAGSRYKAGSCRCGRWSATATTSDQLAAAFQRHLEDAQAVLPL